QFNIVERMARTIIPYSIYFFLGSVFATKPAISETTKDNGKRRRVDNAIMRIKGMLYQINCVIGNISSMKVKKAASKKTRTLLLSLDNCFFINKTTAITTTTS